MDFLAPNPTHVSKSQHGGRVLAFEPQETIKIWLIIIKVGSRLFYAEIFAGLVLKVGSNFSLAPTLNTKSQASPPKSVAMSASMSYLRPVWSRKSQIPCSQRLRLHGLTSSSDLGLGT